MELPSPECANCPLLKALLDRVQSLERRIVELEARVRQTWRNSSRPPSSDPPGAEPTRRRKSSGRKQGGQPGHEGHHRTLLAESEVDRIIPCFLQACGHCGGGSLAREPDRPPVRRQISELVAIVPFVTEYQLHAGICSRCGERTVASPGPGVPDGDFGPRAEATVAYLGAAFRLSVRERQRILAELFGLRMSTGAIKRVDDRVAAHAEGVHAQAVEALRRADVAHCDETSWRIQGKGAWLWAGVTDRLRVFRIDRRRSREAFERLFGADFGGTLITDRLSSFDAQPEDDRQLCWAHLKRDFQAFADRSDVRSRDFGIGGLEVTKRLFKEWRVFRESHGDRKRLRRRLRQPRRKLARLLVAGAEGENAKIRGFCNHLIRRAGGLWTFLDVPGVEPTNNPAERALRHAVLWRKGSFGSQSESGCRFVERLLTIISSLRAQGRPLLDFLTQLCAGPPPGADPPSLLGVSS